MLQISPAIWRRILVRSDTTIARFHSIIQTTMGWEDIHLRRFRWHGKDYGVYRVGGLSFQDDPHQVRLSDLKLYPKERFLYQYNLADNWQHQLRLEQILPCNPKRTYPVCISGSRLAPPEDGGGAELFMENQVATNLALWETKVRFITLMAELLPLIEKEGRQALSPAQTAELKDLMAQIDAAKFERKNLNQALALLASTDYKKLEQLGERGVTP